MARTSEDRGRRARRADANSQCESNGTGVMTLMQANRGPYHIVDADTSAVPFCSIGCVIVSQSTGGPVTAIALSVAAGNSLPWASALTSIPRLIKGHVAFHPALGGSPFATAGLAIASLGESYCTQGLNFLNSIGPGPIATNALHPCDVIHAVENSVLADLTQPTMDNLWRPFMQFTSNDLNLVVPSVIVAGAHRRSNRGPIGSCRSCRI